MILRYNHKDEVTDFLSSDDAIYHFTKKETAIEHIWNKNKLMFGSFGGTNDPHEYKPRMTSAGGWGWDDKIESELPKITRLIDQKIKLSGFISFCQNRYEKNELKEQGCLKSRMWSQYGQKHGGICLVLSKRLLIENFKKAFSKENIIFNDYVEYKDFSTSRTRDSLSINGGDLDSTSNAQVALSHLKENFRNIFFFKPKDYQDENEFRLVAFSKNNERTNGKMLDISSCLKIVILGDAFPEVYLPTIRELAGRNQTPFRKLHWEKGQFILLRMNKK